MNRTIGAISLKIGHVLLMFTLFHLWFLVFYALASSSFFALGLWNLYLVQSLINSVGFVAFYASAFWLFPAFVVKRKFGWLAVITLVISVSLGKLQYNIEYRGKVNKPQPSSSTSKAGIQARPNTAWKTNDEPVMSPLPEPFADGSRAIFNILLYMLLGTGYAYAVDWFRKDRLAKLLAKEKAQSELALLRYQLNPHFLFNTINDIYYLAIIRSEKTAGALLELSNLLRYVLNEKDNWVALDREIAHLQQFVQLHRFRFPNEITKLDIKLEDEISDYHIAPLLLTTFAENAFKHGEPGTTEHPISILLEVKDQRLSYHVSNKVNHLQSKDNSNGIGLNNLQRRLQLLYPNQHNIFFEQAGDYFTAELQIDLSYDQEHSH